MKKVLKFYSGTCGPCKVMGCKLKQLPPEVEVQEIEVTDDSNESLIDKYNIRSIPTIIVVDESGEPVKEFKGIVPIEDIIESLE